MIRMKEKPFYLSEEDIQWVESTRDAMTLEEKAGQLFCLHGNTNDQKELKEILTTYHPGAVMYRPSAKKVIYDTHKFLQENSKIPLLLAANLESGGDGIGNEGTFFGREIQVAATGDVKEAYNLGDISGAEGAAVGVNWSFAPVVDIDMNFENPITNVRTFGNDKDRVKAMAVQYIEACQSHGVAAAAKHFPGDGVDSRDQHLLTTINALSTKEWDATYGEVYHAVIENGVKTIMAGHIAQPAYEKELNPELTDQEIMPASLSKELLQGLLRGKLGFNGMITTDATNMVGFGCAGRRKELLPKSINAGCDMLLFTKNLKEDYETVLEAVKSGIISEERLNEAVTYILATKASLKLHEKQKSHTLIPDESALDILRCKKHIEMAYQVSDKAITLVKDEQNLLPLSKDKYKKVLTIVLGDAISASGKPAVGDLFIEKMREAGYDVERFEEKEQGELLMSGSTDELSAKYDLVIYFANIKTASNQTTVRINWRPPIGYDAPWFVHEIPTMFISIANPYHMQDVPMIETFINAYTANEFNVEMLVKKLNGESSFKGKNPVDPFCYQRQTRTI